MKEYNESLLCDYIEYPQEEMLIRSQVFYDNIKRRHSIRKFSDRKVPQEIIDNCIKAAGTAPSGAHHQPWHFVAIHSDDVKE